MNHIRWVAWGVVDVEALDRMQRRNFIKKLRQELAEGGAMLHCGGSTKSPWYGVVMPEAKDPSIKPRDVKNDSAKHTVGGEHSLKKLCQWVLEYRGETNVDGTGQAVG